jgi:hypothetical protein
MNLINVTTLLCVSAGFLMIILGFVLTWTEMKLRAKVQNALEESSNVVKKLGARKEPGQVGIGPSSQQQAAFTGAAEYIKSLAELAKNLSGLTPAVASFIIATVLFFFAVSLAAINYVAK